MQLLVGLGNPGTKYAFNRHNIGFMAIDALALHFGELRFSEKFGGALAEARIGSKRLFLFKPLTYMNESGQAVGELHRFYKITTEDTYVFHDELALVPGKLRVKRDGGHNGHNGLKSLDAHIGKDYWRVRLGIGHPGDKDRVTPHVLGDFAKVEMPLIEDQLAAITRHIDYLINGDEARFMSEVSQMMNDTKLTTDKQEKAE